MTRYDAAELMLYRIREHEFNEQPVHAGLRQLMMHIELSNTIIQSCEDAVWKSLRSCSVLEMRSCFIQEIHSGALLSSIYYRPRLCCGFDFDLP